jgi:hypothetical protein
VCETLARTRPRNISARLRCGPRTADPLADIHNIRTLSLVMRDGRIIDRDKLPEEPVWAKPKPKA